ncbi:MAG: hypothetical protein WBX38_07645 [Candidatus Sulfotelmatobacter sp.]
MQYSRAIRLYAKKTGRYPLVIQELYDPNGQKYLRKFYKDPITGRDFRFVHTADLMSPSALAGPNKSQQAGGDSFASPDPASAAADPGSQPSESSSGSNLAFLSGAANLAADNPNTGLIFGVASTSKSQSIREFDHKNHYSDWLFFYQLDRDSGHQITGPTARTPPARSLAGAASVGSAQPQLTSDQNPAQ